jgi:hypothetical protein
MDEPFWNQSVGGIRPWVSQEALDIVCEGVGHVYDPVYGPYECARCGHRVTLTWWTRFKDWWTGWVSF